MNDDCGCRRAVARALANLRNLMLWQIRSRGLAGTGARENRREDRAAAAGWNHCMTLSALSPCWTGRGTQTARLDPHALGAASKPVSPLLDAEALVAALAVAEHLASGSLESGFVFLGGFDTGSGVSGERRQSRLEVVGLNPNRGS